MLKSESLILRGDPVKLKGEPEKPDRGPVVARDKTEKLPGEPAKRKGEPVQSPGGPFALMGDAQLPSMKDEQPQELFGQDLFPGFRVRA